MFNGNIRFKKTLSFFLILQIKTFKPENLIINKDKMSY